MSRPKPQSAKFTFSHDGKTVIVTLLFDDAGRHSVVMVNRAGVLTRIDNARGEYKPRVTDCVRLIEQTARGDSPVYCGRQRASRAAKPQSDVGKKLKQALRIFGVEEQ